jgi:hypothetical protein
MLTDETRMDRGQVFSNHSQPQLSATMPRLSIPKLKIVSIDNVGSDARGFCGISAILPLQNTRMTKGHRFSHRAYISPSYSIRTTVVSTIRSAAQSTP